MSAEWSNWLSEPVLRIRLYATGHLPMVCNSIPEISYQMMRRWGTMGAHKLHWLGAQSRENQLQDGKTHDRNGLVWLNCFLDHWLASDQRLISAPHIHEDIDRKSLIELV